MTTNKTRCPNHADGPTIEVDALRLAVRVARDAISGGSWLEVVESEVISALYAKIRPTDEVSKNALRCAGRGVIARTYAELKVEPRGRGAYRLRSETYVEFGR